MEEKKYKAYICSFCDGLGIENDDDDEVECGECSGGGWITYDEGYEGQVWMVGTESELKEWALSIFYKK